MSRNRGLSIGLIVCCIWASSLSLAVAGEVLEKDDPTPTPRYFQVKGYRSFLEVGAGSPSTGFRYGSDMFSLDAVHGYRWNPYLFLGLGTGLRHDGVNRYHDFPPLISSLLANMRINFSQKVVAPAFSASVGHSFSWRDGLAPTGWLTAANFGACMALKRKWAVHWSLGYELQRFRITEYDPSIAWEGTAVLNKNFVKFNVGFHF